MLQLTYIFIQRLYNKEVIEDDYWLALVEMLLYVVIFAILRNT